MDDDHHPQGITGAQPPEGEAEDPLQALMTKRSKLDEGEAALLRKVFPEIINALYDRAWERVQRRGLTPEDAMDLVQESFLALYRSIVEEGYPEDLPLQLNKLVKGRLLNYLRQRRRNPESLGLPSSGLEKARSSQDPERVAVRHALQERLLEVLDPELREVVEAVFVYGLTHEEAATLLDLREGTLKGRIAKAKRVLQGHARRLLPPSQRVVA